MILVAAIVALFVGMVPATSGAQDVGAQALPADVTFLVPNPIPASTIWDSTDGGLNFTKVADVAAAAPNDATQASVEGAAAGAHQYRFCLGTDVTVCGTPGITGANIFMTLAGGGNYTVIPGPTPIVFTNDTSPTDFGKGRVTFNSAGGLLVSYKVGSGPCTAVQPSPVPPGGQATIEIPATQDANFYLASADCTAGGPVPFPVAAGVNFVATPAAKACARSCTQQLFVGQLAGESANNVAAFCTTLNPDLQALQVELKTVFGGSGKDDPATLLALADKINALVKQGDDAVPTPGTPPVSDAWTRTSDGLLELASAIQLAGGVWADLPPDAQQGILDFVNGTGDPDPQADADKATLTAWYLGNCIATATVTFTG